MCTCWISGQICTGSRQDRPHAQNSSIELRHILSRVHQIVVTRRSSPARLGCMLRLSLSNRCHHLASIRIMEVQQPDKSLCALKTGKRLCPRFEEFPPNIRTESSLLACPCPCSPIHQRLLNYVTGSNRALARIMRLENASRLHRSHQVLILQILRRLARQTSSPVVLFPPRTRLVGYPAPSRAYAPTTVSEVVVNPS